jgi:hypothetical protein
MPSAFQSISKRLHAQCFVEGGKSFLQEAAVEIRMMGNDEDDPAKQIIDGAIVDALTGDHLIGNAGDLDDFRRDRKAGIFEPFPSAENFVDPPVLAVIFEQVDAEFDDLVAIRVGASRFHIDDGFPTAQSRS